MKLRLNRTVRYLWTIVSLTALALIGLLPLISQSASAALITSRSITLSNSTSSATGVSYKLTFTPVTTEQELIVDFCGDTPIIGATCAFSNATTPVVSSATSSAGTISYPGTNGHTIRVTGLTMTGGSPFTITFSNVTNPTSVTTFYARVLTYATGNSSGYVPASSTGGATTTGTYVDSGGAALSTAQVVTITATVMEQLTFCVSGAAPGSGCSGTTTPSITLGHGGPPVVLSSTQVDSGSFYSQTSTNALHGVSVALKDTSSTACGGLSSNGGTSCSIAANGASASTIAAGAGKIGMCVAPGASTAASAPYHDTVNSCPSSWSATSVYGLDDTSGTSVLSTYGSPLFTSSGAINNDNEQENVVATASNVTPAGIYTATYSLIATGTF